MLLAKKIALGVGFGVAIVGFLIGVFLGHRSLGMTVFLAGFFIGCAAIITLMFSVPTEIFGRQTGPGIKIAALGFGIVAFGQLIELLFKLEGFLGKVSFGVGLTVMIAGILLAVVRMARS